MVRKAAVFFGGGVRGEFQVGALSHLARDANFKFDIVCGVSTGALTAAAIAQHRSLASAVSQLARVYAGVTKRSHIVGGSPLLRVITGKSSLYHTEPLWRLITENLSVDAIRSTGTRLRVGVTSWETGEYLSIPETHPALLRMILASCSQPVLMPLVEIDGEKYADGGVADQAPLMDAIITLRQFYREDDEWEIHLFGTAPLRMKPEGAGGLYYTLRRTLDILLHDNLVTDLAEFLLTNQRVRAGLEREPKRDIRVVGYFPDKLYADDSLVPSNKRDLFDAGVRAAQQPMTEDDLSWLLYG